MFRAWNIVDNGLSAINTGHNYWEARALVEELVRRGTDVRLLCHQTPPVPAIAGARTIPLFRIYNHANVSNDPDPARSYVENFVLHNRDFHYALSTVEPALFDDSLTLFSTVSERHLLGLFRWRGRFADKTLPKVVLVLAPIYDWSKTNASPQFLRKLWAECPASMKTDLALCVRTPAAAELFERLLGVRPHVLPSPLGPRGVPDGMSGDDAGPQRGPMVVAFVGGARLERGGALMPDVVKRCAPQNIRFFIQAKFGEDSRIDPGPLLALRGLPGVEVHEGPLEQKLYYDVIAKSVVLLPCQAEIYRTKLSGVYLEAKCLGAPVIVPAGSAMAEDVKSSGNGLVFEEYSAAAIAECIARAQRELADLRLRAAACAREARPLHGADRCVDAIEELFGAARVFGG